MDLNLNFNRINGDNNNMYREKIKYYYLNFYVMGLFQHNIKIEELTIRQYIKINKIYKNITKIYFH